MQSAVHPQSFNDVDDRGLDDLGALGARVLEESMGTAPVAPQWERLIDTGTTPALILGAERRLSC